MKKFFYRVQEKDTVFSISEMFNLSLFSLIEKNNLKSDVSAGDILIIEREDSLDYYTVSPFDTLSSLAKKFCVSEESLKSKNGNIPYVFYGLKIKK